jgi:hypothetical protein
MYAVARNEKDHPHAAAVNLHGVHDELDGLAKRVISSRATRRSIRTMPPRC